MLAILGFILITIMTGIFVWVKYVNFYWARQNIPYIPGEPLFGNVRKAVTFREGVAFLFTDLYSDIRGADAPVVGIQVLHKPGLLVKDPDIIKNILVKDFNSFSDRYTSSDIHADGLGAYNLFKSKNTLWRQVRLKLTPTFTSARMKQMFPLVASIGTNMDANLKSKKPNELLEENMRDYCARFTTDVIASCAFGVNAKSLENPNEFLCFFFLPQIVPILKLKVFSEETSNFMRSTVNHVMEERQKTGDKRNDLIDTLIQMKNEPSSNGIKWEGDMLVAQASVYFSAGFETTSSVMSFTLYELAWKPHLQVRLRNEIKEALTPTNGELTYEMLGNLPYLNMVVMEVLRLYPPLPYLDRECTDPKGYSLKPNGNYNIPYRMPVFIPIFSIQRNPQYFENPDEFDPERFSDENKSKIIPYTYMPFGVGPHNCIGERFGLMPAKSGIINFLKNHRVELCDKTVARNRLDKRAFVITPEGGIFLKVIKDPLL